VSEMLEQEEFCRRFREHMLSRAGTYFADGESISAHADETAPAYWDDLDMREEGPEACVDADMSYWGEE